MPSLLPDFISNPAVRQDRLLSSDFITSEAAASLQGEPSRSTSPHRNNDHVPDLTQHQTLAKEPASPRGTAGRLSNPVTMSPAESEAADTQALLSRDRLPRGLQALPSLSTFVPDHQNVESGPSVDRDPGGEAVELEAQQPAPSVFPATRELPEDDGMGQLRRRILDVQSRDVLPPEKARLMHGLLMEGYTRARLTQLPLRPLTPLSPTVEATIEEPSGHFGPLESLRFWHGSHATAPHIAQKFSLTEADLRPTYVPLPGDAGAEQRGRAASLVAGEEEERFLGCAHYRRNIKMQCFTCARWYTCRLCHDEAEDHVLPRRNTKYMLCMLCGHPQHTSDVCHNCGESAARYYCNICKLWDGAPDKSIYHCNDCGLCRVGEGLGKDFFHCKVCMIQIFNIVRYNHRLTAACLEMRIVHCDQPGGITQMSRRRHGLRLPHMWRVHVYLL